MSKNKPTASAFPSRDEVLEFIRDSDQPVGKREIARAFKIKGSHRVELKTLLKELRSEGLIEGREKRKVAEAGALPAVMVLDIVGEDSEGGLETRPAVWDDEDPPPPIFLLPSKRGTPPGPSDRVLARLSRQSDGSYTARSIRKLEAAPRRFLGIFRAARGGGDIHPVDRRQKHSSRVAAEHSRGATDGGLVLAEVIPQRGGDGRRARVVDLLGDPEDAGVVSLIAIHSHGIPTEFSDGALEQADKARPVGLGKRVDLRSVPLVTIDGQDARDFDDAVWAEADTDPKNRGGWHLIVAIADVAHYVRPGDALDESARARGNSVYFPDRVVPMLPEALSNDLCSLRPGQDRPALACHMWIDRAGTLRRHRFERVLMRSAARLTYTQVQAARDGRPDDKTGPLTETVIAPLYGAFDALLAAREARGALEILSVERQVIMGEDGHIDRIVPRPRLDSHRVIEEFMITANVAAAESLESRRRPCMYRVHEPPDPLKVDALREFLQGLGYRLAKGQVILPRHFNQVLDKAAGSPHQNVVHQLVLRSQSQARYSPENAGHFGLALPKYAHFTSPIRRYSDLLVHRGLITAYKLGAGDADSEQEAAFVAIGEQISDTERRAMAAERDTLDRFIAAYMAEHVGARFGGVVNGVTRFGLFITLDDTGADGLIPISTLPGGFHHYDEAAHRLYDEASGQAYTLGDEVIVRLVEANPVSGGLIMELLEGGHAARKRPGRAPRQRGKSRKHGPKRR